MDLAATLKMANNISASMVITVVVFATDWRILQLVNGTVFCRNRNQKSPQILSAEPKSRKTPPEFHF